MSNETEPIEKLIESKDIEYIIEENLALWLILCITVIIRTIIKNLIKEYKNFRNSRVVTPVTV